MIDPSTFFDGEVPKSDVSFTVDDVFLIEYGYVCYICMIYIYLFTFS